MWNYLGECMGIAVQTAIGGFCWLVVVMAFVLCIGIASFLLKREMPHKVWDIEDVEVIDGGVKDDRKNDERPV